MKSVVLLILGLFAMAVGGACVMGNISMIHRYNRRRVTEDDAPKYGRVMGTGAIIMGAGLVAAFFIMTFWSEYVADVVVLTTAIGGFAVMLYGQFRYNGGIF